VWRALIASKSGGVGGGGGSGSGGASAAGKKKSGSGAKKTAPLLRGKGVAVAGQREWRWASSLCSHNPCLSPFYPNDWPEGEAGKGARSEEEASAEREDAKRPPGKKRRERLKSRGGETRPPLLPASFTVARTWPQVREALQGEPPGEEGGGEDPRASLGATFVPAALWPERRGTLAAGSRVFLPRAPPSSSASPSSSPSRMGDYLGAVSTSPPRGCPPGVAYAAGVLRARALWGARFAGETKKEKKDETTKEGEEKQNKERDTKKKKKKGVPSEASIRVVVVLPDGREVVARATPSGVAASLW